MNPAGGPEREQMIREELERILESPPFRNARRSQEFLRYVVNNALEGHLEALKERAIGASVFGRTPDYDTGEDAIVRVKASELRRRLAQYYREAGDGPGVQIDIPAGSYQPEFRWGQAPVVPPAVPARSRRRYAVPAAGLLLGLTLAGWLLLKPGGGPAALNLFWKPVFESPRPVLLCLAHPVVYRQSSDGEYLPDPDHFVGIGDAYALAQLSGFFRSRGKATQIRFGNDVSFADLRNSPAVLIGAFTNQWTMQMTSNLRFVFERGEGTVYIRDQMEPARRWYYRRAEPPADYVVISRLFDSKTGDLIITASGLGHAGTQMAGEILTNPAYLEQAMHEAPQDWTRRNLQLVVTGEVIGKTPGPPKVVASWFW